MASVSRRGFIRGRRACSPRACRFPDGCWATPHRPQPRRRAGPPARRSRRSTSPSGATSSSASSASSWRAASFVNGKQMYVEYVHSRRRCGIPIRSCSCTAAAGRGSTGWARRTDAAAGRRFSSRKATRSTSSIGPGHGRSPFHPDVDGPFPAQSLPLEGMSGTVHAAQRRRGRRSNDLRKLHNQWPGTGEIGSRDLDQLVASQGGLVTCSAGRGSAGAPAGRRRTRRSQDAAAAATWRPRPARCAAPPRRGAAAVLGRHGHAGRRPRQPAHGLASARRADARQDRSVDHHDAFGRRPVRLARRRDPSESRQGHRRDRRRRPAVRRPERLGHVRRFPSRTIRRCPIRPRSR